MLTKRIIACLDVDAGRVVKGTQFRVTVEKGASIHLRRVEKT